MMAQGIPIKPSIAMSPEVSSHYTDRPIRPLPKRRLRERLSPEVADSIKYPPAHESSPPLFYPYSTREEALLQGTAETRHSWEREKVDEIERNYISRRNGDDLDSDEDDAAYRSRVYSRHSADTTGRSYRYVQKPDSRYPNPQPPASTSSSADGYDSFENANNKKKRKIPTPADSNLNDIHLTNDIAEIVGQDDLIGDPEYASGTYNTSSSSHGISGPGRGRYGRVRSGRSPLRTLSDASSNWGNGRTTKQRQQWSPSIETPGIISRSIANANAQKQPITPSTGQENISLLQQQATKKSSPASTQFTFTCDSQVPRAATWPNFAIPPSMHQTPSDVRTSTHATQTSPNMPAHLSSFTATPQGKQAPASNTQKQITNAGALPKKVRRRSGKEYLIAARQRRQQQEYRNYHHPPSPEEIWICEFCEYERIFGAPPEALIKQYEIKDRRIRKQEAERRRLLEKAKMKGRKGKKGSKVAPKNSAAAQERQPPHPPAQQASSIENELAHSHSQGTQSGEYYDEDYDDADYAQDDPPPPSPVNTAAPQNTDLSSHSDTATNLSLAGCMSIDVRSAT